MKNKFSEYYRPTDKEFKKMWEEALFVFDTNVLLKLYRYSSDTREDMLNTLEKIKENIWLPYNVAYEYQQERISVINGQYKPYEQLCRKFEDYKKELMNEIDNINLFKEIDKKLPRRHHPFFDKEEIKEKVKSNKSNIKEEIKNSFDGLIKFLEDQKENHEEEYQNWFKNDFVRKKLTDLFNDNVGDRLDKDELDNIYERGEERYENETPPGYEDKDKDDEENYDNLDKRKFGDLVIWEEMIKKANKSKRPIIFITDDDKEDWWWEEKGKKIGPHYRLREEMKERADVSFYMYSPDKFLEYANDYLKLNVEKNTISEVEEISREDSSIMDIINLLKDDENYEEYSDNRFEERGDEPEFPSLFFEKQTSDKEVDKDYLKRKLDDINETISYLRQKLNEFRENKEEYKSFLTKTDYYKKIDKINSSLNESLNKRKVIKKKLNSYKSHNHFKENRNKDNPIEEKESKYFKDRELSKRYSKLRKEKKDSYMTKNSLFENNDY